MAVSRRSLKPVPLQAASRARRSASDHWHRRLWEVGRVHAGHGVGGQFALCG